MAIGVVLASVAPTFAATGSGQVVTTAASTYTAVPAKGIVNVQVTLKVKNNIPASVTQYSCDKGYVDPWYGTWVSNWTTCDQKTDYYVNTVRLWTEKGITNLKITSDGGAVRRKAATTSSTAYNAYDLTFPRIFKGHTRTVTASYTIKGGAARSQSPTRINGAYLNFGAITQPVDKASVKVIVPAAFEASTWGGKASPSNTGSQKIFASGNVKDPVSYWIGVNGTNTKGFATATITSDSGRDVEIQAWPGDKAWMESIKKEAAGSLSTLERLVGAPLPGTGPIVIREVTQAALGDGYGGEYSNSSRTAEVSENYDQAGTVAHELSHAWFNHDMFAATWLSEGYAGWAERAVGANPTACAAPTTGVTLEDWKYADPRSTAEQRQAVNDEYDAACAVVSTLSATVDAKAMAGVTHTLTTSDGAYPATHDATEGKPNTWQQWLDAVDENAAAPQDPSTSIESMLTDYKVATHQELTDRHEARTDLREIRAMAGTTWTIPTAVYHPMSDWRFDEAGAAMQAVESTIGDANAVAEALPSVAVDKSPLKGRLGSSTTLADVTAVQTAAHDQLATANLLAADVEQARNPGPIEAVGLIGVNVNALSSDATASVAALDLATANARISDLDAVLDGAMTTGISGS